MTTNTLARKISSDIFKLKRQASQTPYLCFCLSGTYYALNIQHVDNILEQPSLVYLSHISPPIVAMQYYCKRFMPVLDFSGYRPHFKNSKLLILNLNCFRNDKPFALIIDEVDNLLYFKQSDLKYNKAPFNELLPSFYYTLYKNKKIHFLDIQDLANQIE